MGNPEIRAAVERVLRGGDRKPTRAVGLSPELDDGAGTMKDVAQHVAGIKYLVSDWIPFGMVTMLVAEPGLGKSAFALYGLARSIITPCGWFTGRRGPKEASHVLWCDTESCMAITVQRIKDWRLPAHRVLVPYENDLLLSVDLGNAEHLEQIEAVTAKYRVPLVVVDSLRGAHGGDENNSRVAGVLKSLGGIAERTGAAVVIVHHTRKLYDDEELNANSSRGSNAILAMVRSQLGIDRPDPDSEWQRLRMLKENLGLKPSPIGFRIGKSGLEFGPAPERPRKEKKETGRDRAERWLQSRMKSGVWYKAADIVIEGEAIGYSERGTLQKAREALGVVRPDNVRRVKGHWEWRLQDSKATH